MKSVPALVVVVVVLVGGVQFGGSSPATAWSDGGTHASTSGVAGDGNESASLIDRLSRLLQDDGDGEEDDGEEDDGDGEEDDGDGEENDGDGEEDDGGTADPTATPRQTPTATPRQTPTPSPTPAAEPTATDAPAPASSPTSADAAARATAEGSAASPFGIVEATMSRHQILADEAVTVTVTVENTGDLSGLYRAVLTVDGVAVDTRTVSVDAGRSETVSFERVFHEPGRYEIGVGSATVGTLTVAAPEEAAERTGSIELVDVFGLPDWVRAGAETSVEAVVVNEGNQTARRTLTVTVDGTPVASETVALVPGERSTVRIAFTAVEGVVAVDGVEAGRVVVSGTLGPRATPAAERPAAAQGVAARLGLLLPVLAVLALVVGAARLARRRR